jgi:hypothetical protein
MNGELNLKDIIEARNSMALTTLYKCCTNNSFFVEKGKRFFSVSLRSEI